MNRRQPSRRRFLSSILPNPNDSPSNSLSLPTSKPVWSNQRSARIVVCSVSTVKLPPESISITIPAVAETSSVFASASNIWLELATSSARCVIAVFPSGWSMKKGQFICAGRTQGRRAARLSRVEYNLHRDRRHDDHGFLERSGGKASQTFTEGDVDLSRAGLP